MGYVLGKSSLANLVGVALPLVSVAQRAILLTAQDFTVFEGVRSLATQAEYVRRGVSQTMDSKHLLQADGWGHAVDLVPWVLGKPRWEWPPTYPIALAMREASIDLGVALVWGGVWDRSLHELPATVTGIEQAVRDYGARQRKRRPGKPVFIDGPHYQLRDSK